MFFKKDNQDIQKAVRLIFLISVFVSVSSLRVQVPPIILPDSIDIRLGEFVNLKTPFSQFDDVYEYSVKEINNKNLLYFPECVPKGAYLSYPVSSSHKIKQKIHHPILIDNINDIIYENSLIDIFYENKNLYVMTASGFLLHFNIDPSIQNVLSEKKVTSGEERLQRGNFFTINQQIYFANGQFIFKVNKQKQSLVKMEGYYPANPQILNDQFKIAIKLTDRFFAILFSKSGFVIYQIDQNSPNKVNVVMKMEQLKNAELTDMDYDEVRNLLFVSDQQNGIFCFKVNIKVNSTSTLINMSLLSNKINVENCHLIYLYRDNLYMSCSGLVKVDLINWPRITIQNIIDTNLKIKQMVEGEKVLLAASSNIMEVFYNNHLIQYIENHGLDKIILIEDRYISVNEGIVIFGKYSLNPAVISCSFKSPDMVGEHSLIVTTEAKCNEKFITTFNPTWQNYNPEDTCLYSVYIKLQIWKPGKLSIALLSFSVSIVAIIVLCLMISWGVNKFKLSKLNMELLSYVHVGEQSGNRVGSSNHAELVEENQECEKGAKDNEKPIQIQLHENRDKMHSIE